jgi:PHD/YefM family antitoxin component YafN of YafNO toxin-antitoxin module
METIPLEQAKETLKQLLTRCIKKSEQYRISTSVGSVVMMSEETYENLLITLELFSTPGLIEGLEEIEVFES